MSRRAKVATPFAIAIALIAALIVSSGASARSLYSTNYESDDITAFDLNTGLLIGSRIPVGENTEPYTVAITPNGKTVASLNYSAGTVSLLDIATNQLSAPISLGEEDPYGIGITPDGSRAYVASDRNDSAYAVDLSTHQVVAGPIKLGEGASGLAITPDGKHVYVSNNDDGTISVINTTTNQVEGPPITVGGEPYTLAITPDGKSVYVANQEGYASVIDTATNTVTSAEIVLGNDPCGVAISPNGSRAYVTNYDDGTVSVIDTATRAVVGTPIAVGEEPEYLAVTPDGSRVMVARYGSGGNPDQIVAIDTATNQVTGTPITAGEGTGGIAIVPDQSPTAAITLTGRARPGVPFTLNGAASTDSDGTVAGWNWAFGDGLSAAVTTPTTSHTYKKPGKFQVGLTVTDNEHCSTAFVFTGQTASCSGSPASATTATIKVAYPGVKVKCPKSSAGPCKFKLKAVQRKKGKLKALSAVAKGKAKPGKPATIALKPKKSFAKKLAGAKKVLVQVTTTASALDQVKVKKLKIVQ